MDESNAVTLEAATLPLEVEISQRRAHVGKLVSGFGSFLGAPYVFTAYPDAVRYLGTGNEDTMFLLVHLAPGSHAASVQQALQARLPEADVWTSAEFSWRARIFWVIKTGAGGAILVAGLLGFIVGLVVVSQNIYATTMENLEEFATLKAIGATRWFVQRVVLHQALVSGIIGSTLGLAATYPIVQITLYFIAWIQTPWWLPFGMIFVSLLMCALAAVFSVRQAVAVEPGRVFRA